MEQNKIPTAEEYINKYSHVDAVLNEAQKLVMISFMHAFAKFHVEAAIIEAADKLNPTEENLELVNSILNAYPLENIK